MRMARRRVNAAPLPPSPLVGEGRGGGSSGVAWPCHTGATPTRDPSPQGGGGQRLESLTRYAFFTIEHLEWGGSVLIASSRLRHPGRPGPASNSAYLHHTRLGNSGTENLKAAMVFSLARSP